MRTVELLSLALTRRGLGTLEGDSLKLNEPPISLPLASALADLQGVSEAELPAAIERALDGLEALDTSKPFRFRHAAIDAGLDAALDRQQFPVQLAIAPGLRFQATLANETWWRSETGSAPSDENGVVGLAARFMLNRTGFEEEKGVLTFTGRFALSALFGGGYNVSGQPVFVFVDERTVWVTGEDDAAGLATVFASARKAIDTLGAGQPRPLPGEIYRRAGPGDHRRWLPAEGHPLRGEALSFKRATLRSTYAHLAQAFMARGIPLPLAALEGRGAEPLVARCTQVPCLVPSVEQVHFETGTVPLAGLLATSMLEPLPFELPWFQVSRAPSREEAAALAHIPSRWAETLGG